MSKNYKLIFKRFGSLEKVWKSMETPGMSPFLHYDYMRFIKQSVALFKPFFTRIACICPEDSDEILMIFPMKLRVDFKYYTLLGDMQGCDIADMLWKPGVSEEEKAEIVRFFFDTLKDKMFLNRIPSDSGGEGLLFEGCGVCRHRPERELSGLSADLVEEHEAPDQQDI